MRAPAWILSFVLVALWGCGGDSSAVMTTSGGGVVVIPSGSGGLGGTTGGQGGSPGSGTLPVPGGARDLATVQCIGPSGTICDYYACLKANCGAKLQECYISDGVSAAAGGLCRDYANCMLACSCDSSGKKCEDTCMATKAPSGSACWTCLYGLVVCSTGYNCPISASCLSFSM
jgi:hypothetical protein